MADTNITGPLWGYEQRSRRLGGLWPTTFTSSSLPNTQWISTLSTAGTNEYYLSVKTDSSGNVYCLGVLNSTDILLVKYNSAGTLQWQKKYTISSSSTSIGFAGNGLFIDSSNNVYMTGGYNVSGNYGFLIKTDSSGAILYQKSFYSNTSWSMSPNAVAVDSTGNAYVIGTSQGFSTGLGNQIAFLTKFNSSGANQWSINFDSRTSIGTSLVIDSSDNILMSGYSTSGGSGSTNQHYIAKINSSGSSVWQVGIASSTGYALGQGITLDTSGNIHISGGVYNSSYYSTYTAKLNSSGSILWGNVYDLPTSFGVPIVTDSSGNSYTGGYYSSGSDNISFIFKHNSSGTLQWQKTINKVNSSDSDYRTALHIDNTGDYYVAGSATNTTDQDSFVSKLPTDGTKTNSYTVGGRTIVYSSASISTQAISLSNGTNPSHTLTTGGLNVNTATFSVSDHTATSSTTTV